MTDEELIRELGAIADRLGKLADLMDPDRKLNDEENTAKRIRSAFHAFKASSAARRAAVLLSRRGAE